AGRAVRLDGAGRGVFASGDGVVGVPGANAVAGGSVGGILPDGVGELGRAGAEQGLDQASRRIGDAPDRHAAGRRPDWRAGPVGRWLDAGGRTARAGRSAFAAAAARFSRAAERDAGGVVSELLRHRLSGPALVEDDGTAARPALRHAADPGDGLLG